VKSEILCSLKVHEVGSTAFREGTRSRKYRVPWRHTESEVPRSMKVHGVGSTVFHEGTHITVKVKLLSARLSTTPW